MSGSILTFRACAFAALLGLYGGGLPFAVPTPAEAASPPVETATKAFERGDYLLAQRLLRPLALRGQASAQYMLGILYSQGQGVPKDEEEAGRWLALAAEAGHAGAQYNVGVRYADGIGVAPDEAQAARWFARAAAQGHAAAQFNLGVLYATGQGVMPDMAQAASLFDKAGRQGQADAQYNLGFLYANGFGVAADPVVAYAWLSLAAASFGAREPDGRDLALASRDQLGHMMSAAEIERAVRAASEGFPAERPKPTAELAPNR